MTRQGNSFGQFEDAVSRVPKISLQWHSEWLIRHAQENRAYIKKSIKELPKQVDAPKNASAIVICGGPSLYRKNTLSRIKDSGYRGTLISVSGSYIQCLRHGLVPDYMLTLEPHETRTVRWFGDPEVEAHAENDDYFSRQDLDIEFRKNTVVQNRRNIELVNRYAKQTKAIVCTSSPKNVVERISGAGFEMYWWNPLIDDPKDPNGLTRRMYEINRVPAFNTGGNVGTAAWLFANTILNIPLVALTGMDFGYYEDLPYEMTQTYYELLEATDTNAETVKSCFSHGTFPLTGEKFYMDPTYAWYKRNFLQLHEKAKGRTYNCTEGGMLYDEKLACLPLQEFLRMTSVLGG